MDKKLRDDLITLARRLHFADTLRREVLEDVCALWQQHRDVLSVDEVAQWTTVPTDELRGLVADDDLDTEA